MKPAVDYISFAKVRKPCMLSDFLKTILVCLFDHKDVECSEQGQTKGSGCVLKSGQHLESYRK